MKQPKCLPQAKRETKYDKATSRNSAEIKRNELSNLDLSQGTDAECKTPTTMMRYCTVQFGEHSGNNKIIGRRTDQWLSGVRDGGGSGVWVLKESTGELWRAGTVLYLNCVGYRNLHMG